MVAALKDRQSVSGATLAGLLVALAGPFLTYMAVRGVYGAGQSPGLVMLGVAIHWLNFAVLIAIVLLAERQPLASIGVRRPGWWTIPLGLVAGVAITVLSAVLVHALKLSADAQFAATMQSLPLALRVLLVVTAGVFEETLYRGYAIERLASLTGSKWFAGAVTLGVFTLMHVPAVGWAHVLPVGIVGLLVTLLYLWRRSLVLNVVAHATVDAIALLLVPMMGR